MLDKLKKNPSLIYGAKEYYRDNPVEFIKDWAITYDPRNAQTEIPTTMPFCMFERQDQLVTFIYECIKTQNNGLIEKCRDMGATWVSGAISVHLWLFLEGAAIGWGSRKEDLVDKHGDMKAIFPKIRSIIENLPKFFWPKGFNPEKHMPFMNIKNPETGASITGETGDNIGRGGRTLLYFKDEALTLTSKVYTLDGYKNMEDVMVGDKVIGVNGKGINVVGLNNCGEFEVYKITLSDGTIIECSPNHIWTLNKVIGKKEQIVIRSKELINNYKYDSPNGQTLYRFRIPIIKPVEFKKNKLPLHPYVVGVLIGDGGLSQVPKSSPKLTNSDEDVIVYFKKCLPDYCNLVKEKSITYRLNDIRGRMGWKYKSRIRQAIVDVGLAGKRSWEKFIPDDYKYSSVKDRIELLRGLMDTDGSAGKSGGSAAYYTSSKRLSEDVRFLAESLGGYGTVKIKKDKRGFRDQYVIFIILPNEIKPFYLKRKLNAYGSRKNTVERSIVNVERTGIKKSVKCITVDSKDGLYLTNGCTPTHNSSHYERPEKIEAALADNTNVQIDISSVNGIGNVFHRRRMSGEEWEPGRKIKKGVTRVFIMDWSHHPAKTQEWYDTRKEKAVREGLSHVFAQEVDRDYAASVMNTIIKAEWVKAAVDAHIKLGFSDDGKKISALDVADEGDDKNAWGFRSGVVLKHIESWAGLDTTETAQRAVNLCIEHDVDSLDYDSIGVGAGVKGETNRLIKGEQIGRKLKINPWAGSNAVQDPDANVIPTDPDSRKNKDMFENLKAQAYFRFAQALFKTYKAVTQGVEYPVDELISIDSNMPNRFELEKELCQPQKKTSNKGKMMIDKKPPGTKSPNLADTAVMLYTPTKQPQFFA